MDRGGDFLFCSGSERKELQALYLPGEKDRAISGDQHGRRYSLWRYQMLDRVNSAVFITGS